jgi:cation diffusion facilitator family transporter
VDQTFKGLFSFTDRRFKYHISEIDMGNGKINSRQAGYREGIISVLINAILFILKFWAGWVTGSLALMADAWHTLSDSGSSIVVLGAAKLSSRKPDRDHPFGHGRWEHIAALVIAFMLAVIAYDFLKNSLLQFKHHESVVFGTLAIVVTVISILTKEGLAQYAFYLAHKTGNISIRADGWHHRTDSLSSVVILVGILLAGRFWWIDSVLGTMISLMLFYATWQIAKEAIMRLLGEKPDPELVEQLTESIRMEYNSDLQVHHFHIHNYVSHQEMTFHIRLPSELTIDAGHRIATQIENMVLKNFGIIATIHVEPLEAEPSQNINRDNISTTSL